MVKKLKSYVHAVERDDKGALTGRSGMFGPDDDLGKPENSWVAGSISNPDVWADGQDEQDRPVQAPVRRGRGDDSTK